MPLVPVTLFELDNSGANSALSFRCLGQSRIGSLLAPLEPERCRESRMREFKMWMRCCAACRRVLRKARLADHVRCECGWEVVTTVLSLNGLGCGSLTPLRGTPIPISRPFVRRSTIAQFAEGSSSPRVSTSPAKRGSKGRLSASSHNHRRDLCLRTTNASFGTC